MKLPFQRFTPKKTKQVNPGFFLLGFVRLLMSEANVFYIKVFNSILGEKLEI